MQIAESCAAVQTRLERHSERAYSYALGYDAMSHDNWEVTRFQTPNQPRFISPCALTSP